jgi:O-antigen/teichoic acid export membrane protein
MAGIAFRKSEDRVSAGLGAAPGEPRTVKRTLLRLYRENSAFVLTAGSGVIAPAVGLLAAPVLTRLYSPAEFGILGTFAAVMAAALSVVNLRYEIAVPLPQKDEDAYCLAQAAMRIGLGGALLTTTLFVIVAPFVFDADMVRSLMPNIWWLPLALFLAATTQVLTQFAIRRAAFGELATARLVQGITGPSVQIGAGAAGFGIAGLLLGQAASQTGGLIRLWRFFRSVGKSLGPLPSARELLKRYERFPRISLLPAFLNAFGLQLPILVIGRAHGVEAAGLVALIFRIMGTPIAIFSSAATQVLLAEGARLRRAGQSAVPLLHRTVRRQFLVTAPLLLLTPFLPWLFPKLFGIKWLAAGQYALALAPTLVIQGIFTPAGTILDINERQDLHFIREIVRICVIVLAVFAAKFWGGTMWAIIVCLSIALTANSLFGYFLAARSARHDLPTAA